MSVRNRSAGTMLPVSVQIAGAQPGGHVVGEGGGPVGVVIEEPIGVGGGEHCRRFSSASGGVEPASAKRDENCLRCDGRRPGGRPGRRFGRGGKSIQREVIEVEAAFGRCCRTMAEADGEAELIDLGEGR